MHSTNLWIHSYAAETFMANPKAKALNALDSSSAQRNILLSYWNQQNKMAIKYKKVISVWKWYGWTFGDVLMWT